MIEFYCPNINLMIGETFVKIVASEKEMIFESQNGNQYIFFHDQDCCEHVYIEDIIGDLSDLENSPLLMAEEIIEKGDDTDDWNSSTWTFYKLMTTKGELFLRWCGESNGYYSEDVSIMYTELDGSNHHYNKYC